MNHLLAQPVIHARGRIQPFSLTRPTSVRDAAADLARDPSSTRAMAGGIDLINALKSGALAARVIYLGDVEALRGIRRDGHALEIFSTTTHRDIERDPIVASALPDVPPIVRELGNIRVRAVGTIGGNLMAGHRNYDWLPILAALGGELSFLNDKTATHVPAEDLTTADGHWRLPRGLLTSIRISLSGQPRLRFIRRFKPVLSIAACVRTTAAGEYLRLAIGCMHAAPMALAPRPIDGVDLAAVRRIANELPDAHDDGYASGEYRRLLASTLIGRIVAEMQVPR